MINKNYGVLNLSFIDRVIKMKRIEMLNILKDNIKNYSINSFLDIGTTEENKLESSNFFIKNFNDIKIKKSITNQNIIDEKFTACLKKSITDDFSSDEIIKFKSDLVISSATIEHVGNFENQIKMVKNITELCNKCFFITTPYRFFPIDFHTKIPIIHMLPKSIHRKILSILRLEDYAKEENLNLLDLNSLKVIIKQLNNNDFKIKIMKIKLFGFTSNLLIYGEKYDL
jgi:hypothetical protein